MLDRLIVAVLNNQRKQAMSSVEEHQKLIREACLDPRVEVDAFQELLVHYTRRKGAPAEDRPKLETQLTCR
jgi:pantetheine-phosphate adenylyltransferase